MSCNDPGCPACRLTVLFEELKRDGADIDSVVPLTMAVIGEVFDADIGMVEIREVTHGTVH